MQHIKEIATAVGTLVIAVGIGFVMQSTETAQQRYGNTVRPIPAGAPPAPDSVLNSAVSADILMQVQEIELTSASDGVAAPVPEQDAEVQRVSAPTKDLPANPDPLPNAENCAIDALATPVPGAMVTLSLMASCARNERLTVHHNGMMFTETTDASGALSITVPALTEQAVFIMAFSNGDGAVVQTAVDDIADYDRVVLQWRGVSGFELHAREFGADYDDDGHIWSGAAQNAAGLVTGDNGYVMQLGDTLLPDPLVAEVYTFPSAMAKQPGIVDLSVETEVSANNCGREIEAQSLEMMSGGKMKTRNLTLSVPECDTIGSFLVLNNLVSDLKVAGN